MTCDRARDAVSAIADGEEPGMDRRLVAAHLEHCGACRRYESTIAGDRRRTAVQAAPEMPDLSRRVGKLAAVADRASSWTIVRAALAVVAVEIIVFSLPDLAARDTAGAAAHDSRHLGAFAVAYAVALLVVVARPVRARTVLPVAAVLAGALVLTAIIDLVNGNVPLAGEALHLPEIISVGLLWALATKRRPLGGLRQQSQVRLRAVDAAERDAD